MAKTEILIIELDSTDSTNNYAMMFAEAGQAQHGMTITAKSQTNGKGQRGNSWSAEPGRNLLMSTILVPGRPVNDQFVFNCAVAVAVADAILELGLDTRVAIKWPNDIIINDKKAGGILIENLLRGNFWSFAVVGLGLNVNQQVFPSALPHATSIFRETGRVFDVTDIRDRVIAHLSNDISALVAPQSVMERYNSLLFRRGQEQAFHSKSGPEKATIDCVLPDGRLQVRTSEGNTASYRHGELIWDYGG